jgi:hypothetical protein
MGLPSVAKATVMLMVMDGLKAVPFNKVTGSRDDKGEASASTESPSTAADESATLPFVIPSAAEGSAVPRTIPGNVFEKRPQAGQASDRANSAGIDVRHRGEIQQQVNVSAADGALYGLVKLLNTFPILERALQF